jgi:riboflavin kinase/FMN adenylyltransferase
MHVFRGLPNPESRSPCALTIGNFDGVHRGHAALLQTVVNQAQEMGLPAAVMTFEPHPREYFAARSGHFDQAPARIANLRDKLEALEQAGIDRVIVEHFNARFAALTAQQFIENILVQGCHARWICVGDDFRFGAKRSGDFDLLRAAGEQWGFGVEAMPTLMHDGLRISSSEVRQALAIGDFALAHKLLGRPYMMSGRVIHGKKLGRTLGFPTLNLRVAHKRPAVTGIFVVRVHGLAEQALPGVASLGVRPTVEDHGRVLLETHVLDWQGDAYGRLIRVEFLKKLRDEEKYDSLEQLTAAIAEDERQARGYFLAINEF